MIAISSFIFFISFSSHKEWETFKIGKNKVDFISLKGMAVEQKKTLFYLQKGIVARGWLYRELLVLSKAFQNRLEMNSCVLVLLLL